MELCCISVGHKTSPRDAQFYTSSECCAEVTILVLYRDNCFCFCFSVMMCSLLTCCCFMFVFKQVLKHRQATGHCKTLLSLGNKLLHASSWVLRWLVITIHLNQERAYGKKKKDWVNNVVSQKDDLARMRGIFNLKETLHSKYTFKAGFGIYIQGW